MKFNCARMILCLVFVLSGITAWGEKASSTPKELLTTAPSPPPASSSKDTMTHFDPSKIAPTKIVPASIDPGKRPASHRRSTSPDAAIPTVPLAPSLRDHVLDDIEQGMNVPDAAGTFESAVNDLFEDAESIRNVPGVEGSEVDPLGDLGDDGTTLGDLESAFGGDGGTLENALGTPEPTTPRNPPANAGGGLKGAPTGPASFADIMGGAASADDGTGDVVEKVELREDEDGTQTTVVTRGDRSTGFVRTDAIQTNPGGGFSTSEHFDTSTGFSGRRVTVYDEDGNERDTFYQDTSHPNRTQDPENTDPDGKWARYHAKISGQRPDLSMKNPNRVGSGEEGADTGPATGKINLGERIASDPDAVKQTGQAREVSDAQAAHWKAELLKGEDRVKGAAEGVDP